MRHTVHHPGHGVGTKLVSSRQGQISRRHFAVLGHPNVSLVGEERAGQHFGHVRVLGDQRIGVDGLALSHGNLNAHGPGAALLVVQVHVQPQGVGLLSGSSQHHQAGEKQNRNQHEQRRQDHAQPVFLS